VLSETSARDLSRGGESEIARIALDTSVGMAFSNIIAFFIILTTAAVLNAGGVTNIHSAAEAAEALLPMRPRIRRRCRRNSHKRTRPTTSLITIAYTFKMLSDDERRAIYEALKGQQGGSAFNADIGTELPPGIELRSVPDELAARVPQTKDYSYAVTHDRVLLVGTSRVVAGVFADADVPVSQGRRRP
jgi:hypothetical protein